MFLATSLCVTQINISIDNKKSRLKWKWEEKGARWANGGMMWRVLSQGCPLHVRVLSQGCPDHSDMQMMAFFCPSNIFFHNLLNNKFLTYQEQSCSDPSHIYMWIIKFWDLRENLPAFFHKTFTFFHFRKKEYTYFEWTNMPYKRLHLYFHKQSLRLINSPPNLEVRSLLSLENSVNLHFHLTHL